MSVRDKFGKIIPAAILLGMLILMSACGPTESQIAVEEPWARAAETTNMAMDNSEEETDSESMEGMSDDTEMEMQHSGAVSAAYMVISNTGGSMDRLIGGSTEAASVVEIHTVEMENDVMRMRPLADGLEIPAGERVTLQPGGYHVMLMDLQQDLIAGEMLTLTLSFESGKEIEIQAEIRNP